MNPHTMLQAYGLETLLTEQDDPELWEVALRRHWPKPDSPDCLVEALRFDIGRRLAEGEQPQGETNDLHAKMRGLVDIEEWCFERVGEAQLKVKSCPPAAPAPVLYSGLGLQMQMPGQAPLAPLPQTVFMYLGISRPSREAAQAVVYAAWSAPGMGDGKACLWQRQEDGHWEQSSQCVAFWIK
jgi:hypothetical protein